MYIHSDLTERVNGAFFSAYTSIGFGYPENICRNALTVELQHLCIPFSREVPIEVVHRGVPLGLFRIDLIIDNRIVVELKASQRLTDADRRQIRSYLKATSYDVGLLLNFGPKPEHERHIYTNDLK